MSSRRQFLGLGLLGAGTLGARGLLGMPDLPDFPVGDSGARWQWLRAQFDFAIAENPRIPMNAANLTPAMRPVREAVHAAAQALDADASFHFRKLFRHIYLAPVRNLLAEQVGAASPSEIALVRNTTEANAAIVNGLDLGEGDEVLLWSENHQSNLRSWGYRAARDGFRCKALRLPLRPESARQLVDAVLAQLGSATRVLSFSAISNISGLRLPVAEICRAAHRMYPDLFIHVDGAQAWGSIALDLQAMGCDSFSGSAHKWLMGPREIGLLYVRENRATRLHPSTIGYDYAIEYPEAELQASALRFENLGQRNDALLPGLQFSLNVHRQIGAEAIERRIAGLGARLWNGLQQLGLRMVTPEAGALRHGIVVADVGGTPEAVRLFRALYEVHGIYGAFVHRNHVLADPAQVNSLAGPSALRLSLHAYNSDEDVDRVLVAIDQLRQSG